MVSDSSLKGFAVYMDSDWVAGVWDDNDYINVVSPCFHVASRPLLETFDKDNINVLELWPIVVGLKRWAYMLKNKSLDALDRVNGKCILTPVKSIVGCQYPFL